MVDLSRISKKQFLKGMNLTLRNARSLLREAELLIKHKAYGRAFALGVLSLEEVSKVVILTMCYHSDRFKLDQKAMNKLWRSFSEHQAKISFFESAYGRRWRTALYMRKRKHHDETERYFKKTVEPLLKAWTEVYEYLEKVELSSLTELKLKCLYVDIDEKPLDSHAPYDVPRKVIKALMLIAKSEIKDAEKLRDTFRRAKTDGISEDIIALMFEPEIKKQWLKEMS